jgi:hypothetical protein
MKRTQWALAGNFLCAYPSLSDKAIDRNQSLGDRIDGQEKTFKGDGAEQRRTVGRDETWGRDFSTVQRQTSFGYRPDIPLAACDDDALRAGDFQFEPFRQWAGYHAKRRASVYEQLDFFNAPRRSGQMAFYVEQSHVKNLKNKFIVAQLTYKANCLQLPLQPAPEGRIINNCPTAKQISVTIPPNVLAQADRVIK